MLRRRSTLCWRRAWWWAERPPVPLGPSSLGPYWRVPAHSGRGWCLSVLWFFWILPGMRYEIAV